MKHYEFTLCPGSEIEAKVDLELLTVSIEKASGSNWVDALNSIDPDCKMYMMSVKELA